VSKKAYAEIRKDSEKTDSKWTDAALSKRQKVPGGRGGLSRDVSANSEHRRPLLKRKRGTPTNK